MKKKSIKVITVLLAMVMLFVSSSSVSAMSLQNTIAHRALKQQIIADKRQYCNFGMTTIKYVYADIDGDHVAELITEPGYGYLTQAIYDYQNGNVRRVATVGQGNFTKYLRNIKCFLLSTAGIWDDCGFFIISMVRESLKLQPVASRIMVIVLMMKNR